MMDRENKDETPKSEDIALIEVLKLMAKDPKIKGTTKVGCLYTASTRLEELIKENEELKERKDLLVDFLEDSFER